MDDLLGIERAHDVEDAVDGRDVRQEIVPQSRTLRRTSDQTGDVGDVQVGWILRRGFPHVAQEIVAFIRHRTPRLVGFDGAEGEVLRGYRLIGEEIEQR